MVQSVLGNITLNRGFAGGMPPYVPPTIPAGATVLGQGTYSAMKATTPADGNLYVVTNYGKGGSEWRYSSTLLDWFPTAPTKIYENTSAALISGVLQTAEQIIIPVPIEVNLLVGKTVRFHGTIAKDGTTDAFGNLIVRLGPLGTTADTALITASYAAVLAAANRSSGFDFEFTFPTATSAMPNGAVATSTSYIRGGSSAANTAIAITSLATTAQTLSFNASMGGTTNRPQFGYLAVEIMP